MQEERAILGFLSEALNFELGSCTSIDAVTDHWDHIHSLGDNDLHDYMIANPEPSHEEQHDLHSSSGTKNEAASSHSEQRRNEIIDLDVDSEQQPSAPNQHVQNSNSPALSIPPVSRNMLPPFQWTEVSLAAGSSTSTVPPVERNLHLDETRPRSIPESPLFIPAPELRNATSGDLNVASAVSTTGSATGVQPPSYQNLPHQQRRRSELARRSLISSLAGSDDHPTLHASPDGLVLQPGGDRQGDSVAGAHHSFRALAAASRGRSSRLTVSQMQNILDVMRRDPNHNLRLEDVMFLNQSLLFDGAAGMHDRYRDMRLDVDNMSYEELLALEERIGDVCTGVNEETISNRLKQRKFKSSTKSPQDAEPCCICQEEYSEGEDMGTLECGHDFHSQCIKEWLKQKNLCPICKTTGLNTAKRRKIG
ncbi:probable E3 ubiquitin-protein ligase RHG1A [Brassica napus]|uniref:probable E3 ubiquitin-protein ligase RHG1A n=1 Tax=Brassica napus TaxID=3708 RepID=UPI0006AA8DDB|nr:probable E3 ubiquitin-protein ligase RHG1A [Brassica napus]XP_048623487.1 probable E3 ubiquitin-protein ligase RHG1A [Brassica napus]XP_048623488.1 probable E3 ubiquitin-protein ligase RHG1A [Brassica napus]XP_048623489.1 probable E3 ubiquitin-protein ligase RHG1A [Brassica napus]